MVLHINDTIWAEGESAEVGIFLAVYMASFITTSNNIKKNAEEKAILEKLAKEFKGISIEEIKKDGGKQHDGNHDEHSAEMGGKDPSA